MTGVARRTSGEVGSGEKCPIKMGAGLLTTSAVTLVFDSLERYFVRGANERAEMGGGAPTLWLLLR